MTISSRTPEGFPSHCPICGARCNIEFSNPGHDAPCPQCGGLVWLSSQVLEYFRRQLHDTFGVNRNQITIDTKLKGLLGSDSLDLVELVMELEEEFDIDIPDEDAENIQTIGDLIRFLEQRRREQ